MVKAKLKVTVSTKPKTIRLGQFSGCGQKLYRVTNKRNWVAAPVTPAQPYRWGKWEPTGELAAIEVYYCGKQANARWRRVYLCEGCLVKNGIKW